MELNNKEKKPILRRMLTYCLFSNIDHQRDQLIEQNQIHMDIN